MRRSAVISECGRYRYSLLREWASVWGGKRACFVMLNPSTADAEADDPTIRRCIDYARRWGYTSLEVVNLYAWRATKPRDVIDASGRGEDVIGPANHEHILDAIRRAGLVVVAWGGKAADEWGSYRPAAVAALLRVNGVRAYCLARTDSGQPGHPLYLSKKLDPIAWSLPE